MKKYFLTYDDETHWFKQQRENLIDSVKKFSDFETISFKKNEIDADFLEKNKNILEIPKGGGVWLWKPYIIDKTLEKLNEGDLLFYMDSTYFFTENFEKLYIDLIEERDFLVWKNKPNESNHSQWQFCHKHVIEKYNLTGKIYQNNDVKIPWAGAILIKKTSNTVNLIKEWLEMCQIKEDIWGPGSYEDHRHDLHRHDQSLLGILMHIYDISMEVFPKKYLQNVRQPW